MDSLSTSSYFLAIILNPTCVALDSTANADPINRLTPAKIIRPEYPPCCLFTILPAIGLPVKTPMAENEYSAPVRVPSFLTSDRVATIAGIILSVQPDAKPYKAAYTMMLAFECTGSQSARLIIPLNTVREIITLKTP